MVTSCQMILLKGCELKVPAEIGSLNICPVLNSFSVTTPGGHLEGSCLFPVPGPWEYKVPINAAFIVAITKNSTRRQHFFMFYFHFSCFWTLLFYFGVELISDIVFVSGVWAIDSLRHRCLSVLLRVLFLI